jgi:hypothetical protein
MNIHSVCLAGIFALLICPLALAQEEDATGIEKSDAKVCVNSRTIRNFDAFTDEHIYVEESGKKYYLFTMKNRCPGLRYSFTIAIKDTTSRVCSKAFGEVVYKDRGQRLMSCRIDTIEAVESKDNARMLVDQRTKDKDEAE